ncbi:MAG: hypothetical protein H0S79_14420 [Anaerolineaceae bacterium]|nr:hypothetical protein [Anaerolineaceae bacterium]
MKRNVIGALLLLAIALQACSFLGENTPDMAARATWTPQPLMTDEPYHVEVQDVSYFGDDTVVAIFGSQDPEDTAPLHVFNLTTEDVYDVSALTPGPISTWSRPIMTEDKQLFFQIGDTLYKLSPGGDVASIEVPFNEEDPVFCNWSWQGQLVCVNDLMTEGYLVDQELNVTAMSLPAYTIANDTIAFYAPYRAGENTMRILQTTTNSVGSRFAVHYRDLDLTTLTITDQQLVMAYDFRAKFYMNNTGGYSSPYVYQLGQDTLEVLGMTDDGEQIFLQHYIVSMDDLGNWVDGKLWGRIATPRDEMPIYFELDSSLVRAGNWLSDEHLITPWVFIGGYTRLWPEVFDIRTGELLFVSVNSLGQERVFTVILPYRDNWLAMANYGVSILNEFGYIMKEYYFPDEIIEALSYEGGHVGINGMEYILCTISQPMEP